MSNNLFELATRSKLRFQTDRGAISVEDLWDLPLTSTKSDANLDSIARKLHNDLKNEDVSFVTPAADTPSNRDVATKRLRFDIVKHIIDVRLAENAKARDEAARKAQKQQILEILERKQLSSLESKSEEELQAMIAQL